jgi:hypothetical protein
MYKYSLFAMILCLPFLGFTEAAKEPLLHERPSEAPSSIEVTPSVEDREIGRRLEEILNPTGWFTDPHIQVEKGVVFLTGTTYSQDFKTWAGDLAHNTQGVTAIVNKIVVEEPSVWSFHMILQGLSDQASKVARSIPALIFSSAILLISWFMARAVYRFMPRLFRDRANPSLLHEVAARGVSFLVFMSGVYFIAEMADLTTMALTVISGTGILGIVVGIAFRDITENFLASILLSLQSPFHVGDQIDVVAPVSGYTVTGQVERLTLRVTMLKLADGSLLQIPNATIYKSNIRRVLK